jgi:hypothetical protein
MVKLGNLSNLLFQLSCYSVAVVGAVFLGLGASAFAALDGPDLPRAFYFALAFFAGLLLQCGLLLAPTSLGSSRNLARVLCMLAMILPFALYCNSLWPCLNPVGYTCKSRAFQASVVIGFSAYAWAFTRLGLAVLHKPRSVA